MFSTDSTPLYSSSTSLTAYSDSTKMLFFNVPRIHRCWYCRCFWFGLVSVVIYVFGRSIASLKSHVNFYCSWNSIKLCVYTLHTYVCSCMCQIHYTLCNICISPRSRIFNFMHLTFGVLLSILAVIINEIDIAVMIIKTNNNKLSHAS